MSKVVIFYNNFNSSKTFSIFFCYFFIKVVMREYNIIIFLNNENMSTQAFISVNYKDNYFENKISTTNKRLK